MDNAAQATAQTLIKVDAKGHRKDSCLTRSDLLFENETRDGITQAILLPMITKQVTGRKHQ